MQVELQNLLIIGVGGHNTVICLILNYDREGKYNENKK